MRIIRHLSLLAAAACLWCLASCGGASSLPADPGQQPAETGSLPAFPVENGGVRNASADGGTLTLLGSQFIQDKWATVDGDALVIGPAQGDNHENTAYGLYKFEGLAGKHLSALTVDALPGDVEMKYFVALADFTNLKWQWFGPISLPEFQYNFAEDANHYISPLGNVYFIVATHGANVTTHHWSTLTFGDTPPPGGGGHNPGAPSELAASDGTFADKVGLTWNAGDGAQWYEIYRFNGHDDPNLPEWSKIGESQTTEFADTNVVAGHVYKYKVRSVAHGEGDGEYFYSTFSNTDTGYPGSNHHNGPGTPQGLIASDGTSTEIVRVTWQASDGAQWYELYRHAPEQDWTLVSTQNGTVYEDADVVPGTTYYYKVRAGSQGDNGNQYSDYSNTDSGFASEHHNNDTYVITVVINEGSRAGTTVTLLGKSAEPYTVQLGDGGVAVFDGLAAGSYLVFPYNESRQFAPEYWAGSVGPDQGNVTLSFEGGEVVNAHRAWGFVWQYANDPGRAGWAPLGAGVKARLDGSQDYHTGETNADGFYGIPELPEGTIIVQPFSDHYTFTPVSNHMTVDGAHLPHPLLFLGAAKDPNVP
jgi:hypothetical protein